MFPADPAAPAEDDRDGRLAFEKLLAELSSRFIDLVPEAVDREIEDAMARVCGPIGIDYCVLWQWSNLTPGVLTPTHIYHSHEELRAAERPRQVQFPWVESELRAGRTVVLPTVEAFPAEAALDRGNAIRLGIRSNLTLPLAVGGEPPVGALAFNVECHTV